MFGSTIVLIIMIMYMFASYLSVVCIIYVCYYSDVCFTCGDKCITASRSSGDGKILL